MLDCNALLKIFFKEQDDLQSPCKDAKGCKETRNHASRRK